MFVIPGGFVPYNDTVTLLTYKRLRNLDLDMDVFAFKGKEDKSISDELKDDECFKKFYIEYTSEFDWAIARNHPIRLPISLILMNKYVHDSLKRFEKKDYKYLFTSIVPGISNICGYLIKKKHPKVIWYASFSDPIKNSPYKKDPDIKKTNIINKIAFYVGSFVYYMNRYEEVAIKNADKLVFICKEQRDFTLKQYSNYEELKEKSIIMPLTYIPEWDMYDKLIDCKKISNNPKQAVHLGRLYGLRKVNTFLEALKELKEEDDELSKKIVFHQYSEIQPYDVEKIKKYNLEDLFIIHDKVTYNESVEVMKNADILVLFDTLMPNNKVQPYLPSKIVEYLLLKKQILGICDQNSPSYRMLKQYGYSSIGSDVETIKNNIRNIISSNNEFFYSIEELNANNYKMIK